MELLPARNNRMEDIKMNINDNKILSHSVWNCKYHIVFAPKYERKRFYQIYQKNNRYNKDIMLMK